MRIISIFIKVGAVFIISFIILVIALFVLSKIMTTPPKSNPGVHKLDDLIKLKINETAFINPDNIKITVLEIDDFRGPPNGIAGGGNVVATFSIEKDEKSIGEKKLRLENGRDTYEFGEYKLRLQSVDPPMTDSLKEVVSFRVNITK